MIPVYGGRDKDAVIFEMSRNKEKLEESDNKDDKGVPIFNEEELDEIINK